ncbi:MAG: S-layer homology domain-containing protein [Microthrixaceae bacterium]
MGLRERTFDSIARQGLGVRLKSALAAAALLVGMMAGLAGATDAGATPPTPFGSVTDIEVGGDHACAVTPTGAVQCWGQNQTFPSNHGRLGDGTLADSSVPVGVVGISDATRVNGGEFSTCAVLDDGGVRCWGYNTSGGLGDGTTDASTMPVAVSDISNATDVVVGAFHACALLDDGTIRCWGRNSNGQLGNGTTTNSSVPVMVNGVSTAIGISAQVNGACALLADDTVKCWGWNQHGQLGDGSTTDRSTPVSVAGLTGVGSIVGGHSFACAATGSDVQCWGNNNFGQLGNGAYTDSSTPKQVTGLGAATRVAAGGAHACAQMADGTPKCWGLNTYGQLGDGTTTSSATPVTVAGLAAVGTISAGGSGACATNAADRALHCWGRNSFGQVGDGTTTHRSTPTQVIAGLCESAPDPGFNDVSASAYYADAVAWLAAMGISTGTGPNTYSPNAVVSRKDMAVFLWRAFDSPEPDGANPFSDVPDGAYYTDATTWLAEAGISTGTSPGMFSPNAPVTRRDMAVFLWRATNSLDAPPHSFGDVPGGVYYEDAVSWLAHVGISVGTAPVSIRPTPTSPARTWPCSSTAGVVEPPERRPLRAG